MIVLGLAGLGVVGTILLITLKGNANRPHLEPYLSSRGSLTDSGEEANPLFGLKVCMTLTQDHPHLPFMPLMRDQFLEAGVAEFHSDPLKDVDLLLIAEVKCNGYAEVYYTAEIRCSSDGEPLCVIVEAPAQGDRPSNLALETVSRVRRELLASHGYAERRAALKELR